MATTKMSNITVDGVDLFYRSAGSESSPVILLLHGFPSSSHQFRNLITHLAPSYRVIAPDLPGFGFTVVPEDRKYKYTFASLATTIGAFVDALKLTKFAIYIFDYGAPTGLRLALERAEAITAIISQNGNAYDEGLGEFWNPIRALWASKSSEDREVLRNSILTPEATKWQYHNGAPIPDSIPPETYHLDQALMERPGNKEIQLDFFEDYGSNLPLYPKFQEYFRTSNVPVLAAWGKNDEIFVSPGAEAFKRDVKKLEVHLIDAPHFALETNEKFFAEMIIGFLQKHGI